MSNNKQKPSKVKQYDLNSSPKELAGRGKYLFVRYDNGALKTTERSITGAEKALKKDGSIVYYPDMRLAGSKNDIRNYIMGIYGNDANVANILAQQDSNVYSADSLHGDISGLDAASAEFYQKLRERFDQEVRAGATVKSDKVISEDKIKSLLMPSNAANLYKLLNKKTVSITGKKGQRQAPTGGGTAATPIYKRVITALNKGNTGGLDIVKAVRDPARPGVWRDVRSTKIPSEIRDKNARAKYGIFIAKAGQEGRDTLSQILADLNVSTQDPENQSTAANVIKAINDAMDAMKGVQSTNWTAPQPVQQYAPPAQFNVPERAGFPQQPPPAFAPQPVAGFPQQPPATFAPQGFPQQPPAAFAPPTLPGPPNMIPVGRQ